MKDDRRRTGEPEPAPRRARTRHSAGPRACPHCSSTDVELEAAFGSSLMSRQYYCRGCRTVFEWVKREEESPTDWLDD